MAKFGEIQPTYTMNDLSRHIIFIQQKTKKYLTNILSIILADPIRFGIIFIYFPPNISICSICMVPMQYRNKGNEKHEMNKNKYYLIKLNK